MCGSDLHTLRAPAGSRPRLIAGHEPCGVVEAVGPGVSAQQARVGQRVMDHHYGGCGVCVHCREGWTQMCESGSTVYGNTGNGSHAEYMRVPAYTCVPLPDELSFAAGAAIACGTGTAYGGLKRLELSGRDTIAVFGQGPVGLSATQLAAAMGARVIALDIATERRSRALEFGAESVLDPSEVDPVEALRDLTRGVGVDCVLDCTSSAQARAQGARACRPWGRVCYVGMGGDVTYDVANDIIKKQLTVMGSWTFSQNGQAECARFCVDRQDRRRCACSPIAGPWTRPPRPTRCSISSSVGKACSCLELQDRRGAAGRRGAARRRGAPGARGDEHTTTALPGDRYRPRPGAACARRFSTEGHDVSVIARSEERLAEFTAAIAHTTGYRTDIARLDHFRETLERIVVERGLPRVVVYNATQATFAPYHEVDTSKFERNFASTPPASSSRHRCSARACARPGKDRSWSPAIRRRYAASRRSLAGRLPRPRSGSSQSALPGSSDRKASMSLTS